TAMIGARVATEAHLVGLICGIVCALMVFVLQQTRTANETQH
ncbi:MAG: rhombosortase, partial [Shewanella sp.]